MDSPQKENGYTQIANETMDALAKIRIPGQARQLLDFIFRKTYGWHKKEDAISLSQFVSGTGLSKVAVCKNLKKLLGMNIITKEGNALSLFTQKGNDTIPTYGFQKRYEAWVALPKRVALPKKVMHVTLKGNQTLPLRTHTKETITKETITKDIYTPILDSWISAKIIQHKKLSDKTKTAIRSALKDYIEADIIQAIENYSTVYHSPEKYYHHHKWPLLDFLNRGLRKFVDEATPLENFLHGNQQSNSGGSLVNAYGKHH